MRAKAIYFALKYGLLPWRCYEDECHFDPMSYGGHLRMNIGVAWRWLTKTETAGDVAFEREINGGIPLFTDVRLQGLFQAVASRSR